MLATGRHFLQFESRMHCMSVVGVSGKPEIRFPVVVIDPSNPQRLSTRVSELCDQRPMAGEPGLRERFGPQLPLPEILQ